jgi:hypothetical protein
MRSLDDITLGDVFKGLARYRPFLMVVAAIALIAVVLPGRHDAGPSTASAGASSSVEAHVTPPGGGTSGAAGGLTKGAAGGVDTSGATTDTGSGSATGTSGSSGSSSSGSSAIGAAGETTDGGFDGNCDPATGRIKVPSVYAPQCVRPFAGDNGGSTWQGVTDDTITIVHYIPKPDPATQAVLSAAGANDDQSLINQTYEDYTTEWSHHVQLYGRKVKLIHVEGTGSATDDAAGKADAVKIAKQLHAFMVWGSVNDAFVNELVADRVLCVCTTSLPADYYLQRAPYVWGNGLPDENQAYLMRSEMICKQIAKQKAKYAGDPTLQLKERSFGLIWYNTTQNSYAIGEKFFVEQLGKCGVKLTDAASYVFEPNSAQQTSDTIIAKFKSEGITSVIFVGDPVYPVFYTEAATRQNYRPEWIITGSALTDTTLFARVYDKSQWSHAFGLSLLAARGPQNESDAYRFYDWRYHKAPPGAHTYGPVYVTVSLAFWGLQGAGPKLTPEAFRDGLFAYPASKPGITNPLVSFGTKIWGYPDYNVYDDSTELWWDNTAQGPDEVGNNGVGMYRFVHMGKRYLPGQFPGGAFPAFDTADTVTIYDHVPPQDRAPDYGPEKNAY